MCHREAIVTPDVPDIVVRPPPTGHGETAESIADACCQCHEAVGEIHEAAGKPPKPSPALRIEC